MNSLGKRVISMVLVLITFVGIFISSVSSVYADSNDRISTYINLAKNGEVTDGDASGMTEDQLRFLGLYLSNFYVPFGTEIGTSGSELAETTKKDMVETLQQKFAFSEELATSIVDTVFGYTRSSLKDLQVYASEGYQDGNYIKVEIAPNYYNFLRLMEGRADDVFNKYFHYWGDKNNDTDKLQEIARYTFNDDYANLSNSKKEICKTFNNIGKGKYKYFYFAYSNEGTITPVADCYVGSSGNSDNILFKDKSTRGVSNYTASQVAFLKCLEASNIDKGYGFSFMDFADSDGVDSEALKELKNKASKTEIAKMSIYGTTMAVDCFGDIVSMGANHQVVVMPGCINPYSWMPVDSNGDDISGVKAGFAFNIANAISMTQAETSSEDGKVSELINSVNTNVSNGNFIGPPNPLSQFAGPMTNSILDPFKNFGNNQNSSSTANLNGYISCKPNFEVLNKNLKDMKLNWSTGNTADGDYAVIGLRCRRGNKEYALNSGFLGMGGTEERDFFIYAMEGFQELYPNDNTYQYSSSNRDPNADKVTNSWWSSTASFDCVVPRSKYSSDEGMYYGAEASTYISMLTNVVFIDNLGVYQSTDGTSSNFSTFNIEPFLDGNGKTGGSSDKVTFGNHSFGNLYNDIKTGKLSVPYDASEQALCTLYVTYCLAGLYDSSNKADTIGKLGYRINVEGLPDMNNKPISLGGATTDAELNAIKDWLYYLLHPTEGFEYTKTLITNKVNHLLLGWHSDMVGTNGVGATTGTTRYRSHMGYVTMPDLSEVQWTNALINFYNDCVPFLIVILIVIMIFAFITGILDLQHALLGILLFSIFTLIPVNLINAVVGQSNRISQNIYGDKFTYWALVQQESYSQAIDEAANAPGSTGTSSYGNYLRTLYAENEAVYTNQGGESILLKWQAPKKMASLVLTDSDAKALSGLSDVGQQMLSGMLNKTYSGQSYTDDEDAVYMYRSYTDISNFSRYIYSGIAGTGSKSVKYRKGLNGVKTDYWASFNNSSGNLIKSKSDLSKEYKDYIISGYTNGVNFNSSNKWEDQFYLTVPLSSNIINDALKVRGEISNFKNSNDMIPINADIFNFGIPMFTNADVKFDSNTFIATGMITDGDRKKDLKDFMNKYKSEEDYVGLAAYGLYSENPYYYFSWKLYSDGLDSKSSLSGSTGFKNLLLGQDKGGYFYNTSGNEGLKDFMNMKGLFTYIIPYMKQCNDLVREWDNTFGIFIYDGVPTEEGHWDEVKDNPELKQKYWHNLNVTRLYDLYCPWVDVMYDCSYSNAENITVMGKRVTVSDPINPNSYPKDRPMIFSESEMADYGLSEADLTKVEKLILKCNEQYQERLYELLNYYNFSDTTLNSAAAMNCAFVFNNTFSENGLFSENHNIYPQSFDLENFSYDAFLRFILSNSTGESMLENVSEGGAGTSTGKTTGDFYEKIVNRSSIVTVIVMLILDVLSIYLIPAFRIFFLIAIFLVSVCIILVSAFKIEDSMKFVRKVGVQFFIPLMLFFVTTVVFSWVISLFMGVGNNDVTQTEGLSISMGDPVVTMLVMIALNLLLLFIYWKIIKQALQSIKHHAKLLKGFGTAVLGAGVGFVAGAVSSAINGVQNAGDKAYNGYRRHKTDKMHKKNSRSLETLAENSQNPAQEGTGVENSRASERGSSGSSSTNEDIPPIRDVDKDKREADIDTGKDTAEESEAKKEAIDDKAKSGSKDLQDSFTEERFKRYQRANDTIDRDFGYAKNENGSVDKSKLSAKDRYKYQNRVDRVKSRETALKKKEREQINDARNRETQSSKNSSKRREKIDNKKN